MSPTSAGNNRRYFQIPYQWEFLFQLKGRVSIPGKSLERIYIAVTYQTYSEGTRFESCSVTAVMSEVYRDFPNLFQENARLQPLPHTSPNSSFIIMGTSFEVTQHGANFT
jgi:hypothetical protein